MDWYVWLIVLAIGLWIVVRIVRNGTAARLMDVWSHPGEYPVQRQYRRYLTDLKRKEANAVGQCDVCNARYDAASSMDHCAREGLCWEHCTDFASHASGADDVNEPDYSPVDDELDRAYDTAVDLAVGAAIEAGEPDNWKAYLPNGGAR